MSSNIVRHGSRAGGAIASLLLVALGGCAERSVRRTTNFIVPTITTLDELGPLCGQSQPSLVDVAIDDPDDPEYDHHPGGVVLRHVDPDGPLATAGLKVGDVLVRVGDTFLPNTEHPHLRLIEAIENEVSAGRAEFEVGYVRRGYPRATTIAVGLTSLDAGMPLDVHRFHDAANRGLGALAHAQRPDGSFATAADAPDARRCLVALAGLAFVAGGSGLEDGPHRSSVRRCLDFVRRRSSEPSGALAGAFVVQFLTELIGPEPNVDVLAALEQQVGELIQQQRAGDGGFSLGADDRALDWSVRSLATHAALTALGAAERVGVGIQNDVVERACAHVTSFTNGGFVAPTRDPSFDRRLEAGRSAWAAAGLLALGCSRFDPLLKEFLRYHDEYADEIDDAPTAGPLLLLGSGRLAWMRGRHEWERFVRDHRYRLVAAQRCDGSFTPLVRSTEPLDLERAIDGDAYHTAVATLLLLLPEGRLAATCAKRSHPIQKPRHGDGTIRADDGAAATDGPAPGDAPEGAPSMTFTSLEEAREFLKSMGLDPESAGLPPDDDDDDDDDDE